MFMFISVAPTLISRTLKHKSNKHKQKFIAKETVQTATGEKKEENRVIIKPIELLTLLLQLSTFLSSLILHFQAAKVNDVNT